MLHATRLSYVWRAVVVIGCLAVTGKAVPQTVEVAADVATVPGVVIDHVSAHTKQFVGSPTIVILPDGSYVTADGRVLDILRVEAGSIEKAAIVSISADGTTASFDPVSGFIDLPGSATKFTIRRDPRTETAGAKPVWWMLSNAAPPVVAVTKDWNRMRNTLALLRSEDLRTWELRSVVLHHPERQRHGFQYVDWLFDGDDLVVVSRTAFDDAEGGAHDYHDANYLTFHRVKDFRSRSMADSCVDPKSLGW